MNLFTINQQSMDKKKLKFYPIENKFFKAPLSLYVGDWQEYNKEMKRLYKENIVDGQLVCNSRQAKYWFDGAFSYKVMFLPELKNISMLVHELCHYCFDVLQTKGVIISQENDEVFAYMFEYMFDKINNLKK